MDWMVAEFGDLARVMRGPTLNEDETVSHDTLTGLLNRRGFIGQTRRAMDKARADLEPVTMLMIDADQFRRVNAMLGFETADAIIHGLGRVVTAQLPEPFVAGRIQGARFAVVLRGSSAKAGERAARSISTRAAQEDTTIPLTVSVGLIHRPVIVKAATLSDAEGLLSEAYEALVFAKSLGKGCVHSTGTEQLIAGLA